MTSLVTPLWQGVSSICFAGGHLWTGDGQGTGFGTSNNLPQSVFYVTVLDPTSLPYPRVINRIDLRKYVGPYIKNIRKIKKSPDGTKVYVCTYGWYGEFCDRGTQGYVTAGSPASFSANDPPRINGFIPNYTGLTVTISGANDPNNNGTFPYNADGSLINPLATTDANNGSLVWHLNTPGQSTIGSPCGLVFIFDSATMAVLGICQMQNGVIADAGGFNKGDGSEARDCLDDGAGNLWAMNLTGGGGGNAIGLLEKFDIATAISNGPFVRTVASQQYSIPSHGEEMVLDSGYIWTAGCYVGGGNITRINPSDGSQTVYNDSAGDRFWGMLSDTTGRSPFPGAIYSTSVNYSSHTQSIYRFDPTQFPNPGFKTNTLNVGNCDGGAIVGIGSDLWFSSREPVSGNQANFYKLDPSDLTVLDNFATFNSSTPFDGFLGCWQLDWDGTYLWGARRGFRGSSGIVQVIPGSSSFQNSAGDNVMQFWQGQFTGYVMQARSSSNNQIYTWFSIQPDFGGIGYTGPGTPQEIAVLHYAPLEPGVSVMQARDSSTNNLVTWVTNNLDDFEGIFYPGPGTPLEIAVAQRNPVFSNIDIIMQAKSSSTNQLVPWNSGGSFDWGGEGFPGPGTPSEEAIDQFFIFDV